MLADQHNNVVKLTADPPVVSCSSAPMRWMCSGSESWCSNHGEEIGGFNVRLPGLKAMADATVASTQQPHQLGCVVGR